MFDWDAVIIGGGPAGLTAGLYLSRGRYRTILLEKESFGGTIKDVELIENYPGFVDGVSGTHLASEMMAQATKYGLQFKQVEVNGIELFTSCMWVKSEGADYTAPVVIIAGGAHRRKLGVPGEDRLQGKGVFNCVLCDGGEFADQVVAVCGGGDAGVTEAIYLTKMVSKVILLEEQPALTASAILQERALANAKLEIRCKTKVTAIVGESRVEAIEFLDVGSGQKGTLEVAGVLVYVGLDANTGYLEGTVPLDSQGQIIVNDRMETETPHILAAGDIRSGSPRQIISAAGDGAIAAISAQKLLQELE